MHTSTIAAWASVVPGTLRCAACLTPRTGGRPPAAKQDCAGTLPAGGALLMARPDRLTLVAFAAMVLFVGGNAVGVRVTVAELPPLWAAALRFGLAGGILAAVTVLTRRPLPRGDQVVGTVLFGILGFGLGYTFIYIGLRDAPAGTAQVMLAVVPLMTLFLARLHGVERVRREAVGGAVVATAGIAVVFGDQVRLDVPILALLALLATAACAAESNVIVKRYPPGDPIVANAIGMLLGAALLLALSFVLGEPRVLPARSETWLAIAYLVVFGSITVFILVLYVLRRWSATAASYSFLMAPLITIALGAALLGGALVVLGVYVGAVYRRSPAAAPAVAAPEPP